jgi:cell pole-organizing protein PopZ
MDEKILIYIVIGIIYFLFNRLKKKNPQDESEYGGPLNEPDTDYSKPKPVSFEDLLREITEGKQPKPAEPVVPQRQEYAPSRPQPVYVDYDDEIEEEEKSLEKVPYDQGRANEIYENAKKQAFIRPSLEESLSLADVNTTFGKFKEFEVKTERNSAAEFIKDLRDPKGMKRAIILNEVLNRRHF